MFCRKCGNEVAASAKFCGKCGMPVAESAAQAAPAAVPEVSVECPQCHAACKPGARFCRKCGHSFAAPEPSRPAPAPVVEREPVLQRAAGKTAEAAPAVAASAPVEPPLETARPDSEPDVVSQPADAGGAKKRLIAAAAAGIVAVAVGGGWWMYSKGSPESSADAVPDTATAPAAPAPQAAAAQADTMASAPVPSAASTPVAPVASAPAPAQATAPVVPEPRKSATSAAKPGAAAPGKERPPVRAQKPIVAPSVPVSAAPPPKPEARTVDDQYNDRAAKECAHGLAGLVCRERLKLALCDGRWSESPPAGQKLCTRYEQKKESVLY